MRRGTSLTEVLVALLIMAIGIVTIATLFPMSVMQTVEATLLTRATTVRYNAEAMMNVDPELIYSAGTWQPDTAYSVGDIVVAPDADGRRYRCVTGGMTGSQEPQWPRQTGVSRSDGLGEPVNNEKNEPIPYAEWELDATFRTYVIDPLGYHTDPSDSPNDPTARAGGQWPRHLFGADPSPSLWGGGGTFAIRRFDGRVAPGCASGGAVTSQACLDAARRLVVPGHYDEVLADVAAQVTDTALQLPVPVTEAPSLELSDRRTRIVLHDIRGRGYGTQTRTIIQRSGNLIGWSEDANGNGMLDSGEDANNNGQLDLHALPPTFYATEDRNGNGSLDPGEDIIGNGVLDHGEFRLERREDQMSWMLTVALNGVSEPRKSLVVFFRRALTQEDERSYPAGFGPLGRDGQPGDAGVDDDGNGTVDDASEIDWHGTDDREIVVRHPPRQRPAADRGDWIMDVRNGRWYHATTRTEPADDTVIYTVDSKIQAPGNAIIAPQGVVHVFSIQ